jgi:methionyl-tRNA synthetase
VDATSALFRAAWDELGISYDDFIRTTDERHEKVVQDLWRAMEAHGDIYLGKYEGWYSVGDEAYFNEDEIVDGKSPSGHVVAWTVEESYFFRLSAYGDKPLRELAASIADTLERGAPLDAVAHGLGLGRIGAALGLEGAFDEGDLAAELAGHVLDHGVAADADAVGHDLHRQVPVAQMPGHAGEIARLADADFRQWLGGGDHLH